MFTLDNTEGYTQNECDVLNKEFETRFENNEWETADKTEAEKWCSDEVAGR